MIVFNNLQCTEPCNDLESTQTREVVCISDNSKVLPDDKCDMTTKPANKRACEDCAMWSPQEWTQVRNHQLQFQIIVFLR